ncbi:MAG: sensor histidine kinase N-terminal domain-containing protein [Betaproteobacteria bacterium]|nr:sensor histidine kinase N-terminal domain-containing protein [Betaproteobacteria bacterium]
MPSKSTSTTFAESWAETSSRPSAAWATPSLSEPPATPDAHEPAPHLLPARFTLKQRVFFSLCGAAVVAWIIIGVATHVISEEQSQQMFDSALRDVSNAVLTFADHELAEVRAEGKDTGMVEDAETIHSGHVLYQIWDNRNKLVLKSSRAPRAPLTTGVSGFGYAQWEGRTARTYSAWNESRTYQIQALEPLGYRQDFSWKINFVLLGGLVLSLLVFVGLLRWIIAIAFHPLSQTVEEIARRSPSDLQPVSDQRKPQELLPLIAAFNHLLSRIVRTLNSERRFTSDAAHELRTPLAALKIQAQVARRSKSEAQREEALLSLDQAVARTSQLVDQLLALARYDSNTGQLDFKGAVALDRVLAEVIEHAQPHATSAGVQIRSELTPVQVRGNPQALAILTRNVIDNAIRYSWSPGQVLVRTLERVVDGRHEVLLQVDDSGPGIPAALRERVFDRFYRISGNNSVGSGLGLAIVKRIADIHQARVVLGESPTLKGLQLTVVFPKME